MNIRDLTYLVAIADHLHFAKAADACFVSQPTLSMQIKKLEQELNVLIFKRSAKKITITPHGQKIIDQARLALSKIDDIKKTALQLQDPYLGTLRLGIIPTLAPYLIPIILPKLQQQLPKLELVIEEAKTEELMTLITAQKLDAIITALPINQAQLTTKTLFDEAFYLAINTQHPLNKFKTINLNKLNQQTVLLLTEGHCFREQALSICQRVNSQINQQYRATSLTTLINLVSANQGITLLPALAAQTYQQQADISIKPFSHPQPKRSLAISYMSNCSLEPCIEEISQIITHGINKTPICNKPSVEAN